MEAGGGGGHHLLHPPLWAQEFQCAWKESHMSLIFNTTFVLHWLGRQNRFACLFVGRQPDELAERIALPVLAIAAVVFRPHCPPLASQQRVLEKANGSPGLCNTQGLGCNGRVAAASLMHPLCC